MDIRECPAILSTFENTLNHIVSEHGRLVLSYAELSKKRDTLLKEYANSKGTIFSSLFKFRYENFHSEMLRKILDKNTPEIGNPGYLQVFVDLLHKINPKIKHHFFLMRFL